MNCLQIYRELRRHGKLGEKRHPMLEQSMAAKVMMYIGAGYKLAVMTGVFVPY